MFTWKVIFSFIDSADEKEDYFTLAEVKEKLEEEGSWKTSIFEGGLLDDIQTERIEKHLESRAVKEGISYDFSFYTPSCRDVRVQVQFWVVFLPIPIYIISWTLLKVSFCQKPNNPFSTLLSGTEGPAHTYCPYCRDSLH